MRVREGGGGALPVADVVVVVLMVTVRVWVVGLMWGIGLVWVFGLGVNFLCGSVFVRVEGGGE